MLLPLLYGEVLPPTFFKLARVVKLRVQIDVISRETLKCRQKWTSKDLHVSERPYEEVIQCLSPVFFLGGLYLPHTLLPTRPGAIRVKKRVPGYQQVSADLPVLWWRPLYSYSVQEFTAGFRIQSTGSGTGGFTVTHLHGGFEVCEQLGP